MQDVRRLYDLQEADLKAAAVDRSLEEVGARLVDESAISDARASLARLQERLQEFASNRHSVEQAIEGLQDRLQKIDARLYGGAVTSERELTAAQEEREFTAAHHGEEEDKLLGMMVEIEDIQKEERQAQESLDHLETARPTEVAELSAEQDRLTGELDLLASGREQIVPLIDAQALSLYESLRRTKDGQAVARVERGMCQGCRVALSTMEAQRARSARLIVQCSSCRRILYVP